MERVGKSDPILTGHVFYLYICANVGNWTIALPVPLYKGG